MAFSFDVPARQAVIPNLVPREILPSALSMSMIAFQLGSILGPALSGLVIAGFGIQTTYLINALSFGSVILALIVMGPITQDTSIRQAHVRVDMEMIREGLHFTFNNPLILSSMILDFIATFFASANTLMPIFAREVLGLDAQRLRAAVCRSVRRGGDHRGDPLTDQRGQAARAGSVGGSGRLWDCHYDLRVFADLLAFLAGPGPGRSLGYGQHGHPPDAAPAPDP